MGTVLITGGHSGLGFAAAKKLASMRVDLVLAGRDLKRIDVAARQLRSLYGVRVSTVALDLASLISVRAAATRCRDMLEHGEIDSLQGILCNAGVQRRGPISFSANGYEETFAVNCLGHFLLVNLLLDLVADGGRVVFTASGTHDPDTMDGILVGAAAEPDAFVLARQGRESEEPLSGGKRYTTSKLVTMLYAYELDRKLRRARAQVASIAFDPGLITETELGRNAPRFQVWLSRRPLTKWLLKTLGVTMGSLKLSGDGLAKVVAGPDFANGSGKYFQSNDGKLIEARSSRASYDEAKAAKVWQDSAELVNLQTSERPTRLMVKPAHWPVAPTAFLHDSERASAASGMG